MNLWAYVAGFLTAVVAAAVSVWLKYILDQRAHKNKSKNQLYQKLMGLKDSFVQIEILRCQALLEAHYHNKMRLFNNENPRLHERASFDAMEQAEKYTELSATTHRELLEVIGGLHIMFAEKRVQALIDEIYSKQRINILDNLPSKPDSDTLTQAKDATRRKIASTMRDLWHIPLNELAKEVKKALV